MRDQGPRADWVVPRKRLYEAMARWGERRAAALRENHDPGDEDRS